MKTKEALLNLLYFYPADYISGEVLAKKLGISRNAVYKHIRELRKEGYNICGCTNRGYALSVLNDVLSPQEFARFYPVEREKLRIFSTLPSTNTAAKEMAACGAPSGTLCIAETQTGGRGRMGRDFFSPRNSGIYMSLILRPKLRPADALQLTTLAAVAVSETVEELTGQPAQIKWVNDVFFREKKVCGILTEASFNMESGALDYAILGIGLNVYAPKGNFPTALHSIAGAVLDAPIPHARCRIIAGILKRFYFYYDHIEEKAFLEPYRKRMFLTGQLVEVHRGAAHFPARVLSVQDDFSLTIQHPDGKEETLSSGEVSLRFSEQGADAKG